MANAIRIGDKLIGKGQPVFIIAELSANHNQDFELAVKTIKAAKEAGADAIKLQTYTADTITIDCANEYFQIKQGGKWDGQTLHQLYQKAYTPWDWQPKLKKIAEELGLLFFSAPFDNTAVDFLGRGRILGNIPVPVLISFVLAVIALITMKYTRIGVHVLAVGGHEEGARVQGVSIKKVKIFVFILTSILAMFAGVIVSGRLGAGTPNLGQMFNLEVITAVVLGGTNLFGGSATIFGTVVGALFVGFLRNGLNLQGVSPFWVEVVTGAILVIAVYFNTRVSTRLSEMIRLSEMQKTEGRRVI